MNDKGNPRHRVLLVDDDPVVLDVVSTKLKAEGYFCKKADSGEEALSLLIARLRSADIDLSLSGVTEPVMEVLVRTHLREKIGEDHIYPTQDIAIEAIHAAAHERSSEPECPLLGVELAVESVPN